MCDQIGAHTETILGINQYVTHCHKYVAAPQGRGLCKNQSTGLEKVLKGTAVHHNGFKRIT